MNKCFYLLIDCSFIYQFIYLFLYIYFFNYLYFYFYNFNHFFPFLTFASKRDNFTVFTTIWKQYFACFSHCVKSVRIRSFSGSYCPAFGLNTEINSVNLRIQSKCGKITDQKNFEYGHFSRRKQYLFQPLQCFYWVDIR